MKSNAVDDLQNQAEMLRAQMLRQIAQERQTLGLTQTEVADRIGRTRMTVQRAEADGGNVALGSFVELALSVGLTPRLLAQDERIERAEDDGAVSPLPENVVHRGYSHIRTQHDLDWDDRKREAALAKSWEAVNVHTSTGLAAVMKDLVPNHTQAQASAVATAMQWLGSEVGFEFLQTALADAGYSIEKKKAR